MCRWLSDCAGDGVSSENEGESGPAWAWKVQEDLEVGDVLAAPISCVFCCAAG